MTKNQKKIVNPVILRRDTTIGHIAAEADEEFLLPCFVDNDAYEIATNISSPKMFLSGRTGAGKTAILKKIESDFDNVSSIELKDLALNYVANSDAIRFAEALGVDLDLLFQALWKHVFCIQYIRLKYRIKNEHESKNFFQGVIDRFKGDQRKDSAIKYLKEWEGEFWISMDENIKEIARRFESQIELEVGAEIEKFKARAGHARTLSEEKRYQLVQRIKKVVNSDQLQQLSKVMELLSEEESKSKYKNDYYILIDQLDEKWVDDRLRFELIRSLIECLKGMRKLRNLKIVVSIREDVLDKVIQTNNFEGFQSEKYKDYLLKIRWSRDQLENIVNRRINHLFKKKYSSENVNFNTIFSQHIGKEPTFTYLVHRTLMRPRDIIEFVNECLEGASGYDHISETVVRKAEVIYSRKRLSALINEWQSNFPSLIEIFNVIKARGMAYSSSKDFWNETFVLDLLMSLGDTPDGSFDPVYRIRDLYNKDSSSVKIFDVSRVVISQLYRIGAVSIKVESASKYWHSSRDEAVIDPNIIRDGTKVAFHKMLLSGLNMQSR